MAKHTVLAGVLAVLSSILLMPGVTFAAGMPSKAPMAAPAYSWTGFYVGLNGGYGWKSDPTASFADTGTTDEFPNISRAPVSYGLKGFTGGVQAGYNWQVNKNWLFGLETDFNSGKISGSGQSSFLSVGDGVFNTTARSEVDWFGTLRGRVGYLTSPDLLLFGTGGFAYGHVKTHLALVNATMDAAFVNGGAIGFLCGPVGSECFIGDSSKVQTGYVIGAGFEYAFARSVSLKVEYSHVKLNSAQTLSVVALSSNGHAIPGSVTATVSDIAFNIVRLGFNYKF
jgi:outer membrane immunogenic protein